METSLDLPAMPPKPGTKPPPPVPLTSDSSSFVSDSVWADPPIVLKVPWTFSGVNTRTPAGTLKNLKMNLVPWVAPPLLMPEPGVRKPSSTWVRPGKSVGKPSVLNAVENPSDKRTDIVVTFKRSSLTVKAPVPSSLTVLGKQAPTKLPSESIHSLRHCCNETGNGTSVRCAR